MPKWKPSLAYPRNVMFVLPSVYLPVLAAETAVLPTRDRMSAVRVEGRTCMVTD